MTAAPDSFISGMTERRRADIAAAYGGLDRSVLERLAAAGRPVREFAGALREGDTVAVIAEVKRASPSTGPIAPEADAAEQARHYERGGAAAISVLTEPSSFGGSFEDLAAATAAVYLPALCKDFVVHEAQILVARGCGADAVLLMVSVLGEDLSRHVAIVRALGMQALVEVASREELDIAFCAGATLVGVNARDLHSLKVDPIAALTVVDDAKEAGLTVVLASGVRTRAHVEAAAAAGADAVLVGEALMRAESPEGALAALASVPRRAR